MYKLKIVDDFFGHSPSLGNIHQYTQNIIWDRTNITSDDVVFYTDNFKDPIGKIKIAFLIESPLVTPHLYSDIQTHEDKFDYIFTFNEELLKRSPKYIFLPLGGCWIPESDTKIYEKTRNISKISSSKRQLIGHQLRHDIISVFGHKIDFICGRGYSPIDEKLSGLKDFRYSIVVENCQDNFYFTEKLIDCFLTGTIPVYWGCSKISTFFDVNGMFTFNTLNDLNNIFPYLTSETYTQKLIHVQNNFQNALRYTNCENNIVRTLHHLNIDVSQYKVNKII